MTERRSKLDTFMGISSNLLQQAARQGLLG